MPRGAGYDSRNDAPLAAREALLPARLSVSVDAWQEIEVWALAGLTDLPSSWIWKSVRAEPNAKEAYFESYVRQKGLTAEPFGGRLRLGQKAAQNYSRIRKLCPEDVAELEARLRGGEESV